MDSHQVWMVELEQFIKRDKQAQHQHQIRNTTARKQKKLNQRRHIKHLERRLALLRQETISATRLGEVYRMRAEESERKVRRGKLWVFHFHRAEAQLEKIEAACLQGKHVEAIDLVTDLRGVLDSINRG